MLTDILFWLTNPSLFLALTIFTSSVYFFWSFLFKPPLKNRTLNRLKLNDVYDYPTLKIIEEGVSSDGIFDTTDGKNPSLHMNYIFHSLFTEQIDLGQPRVPRAKTFPDLVLHPVGHFQLAQNRQDQTIQNTQNSLTPQETGRQEITYDYTDLVYEYPEYDDQYNLFDEDKEQDFSNIKIEKQPASIRADNSRLIFDF